LPVCSLAWGQRQFQLCVGEHIIGRDESADVRLDASTVSRRHTRLVVDPGSVRLEDLGSKNGTFRAQDRVAASIQLSDGDVVRIGSLTLTIRLPRTSATTDTAV
jgi:pSer/pThr/pTyr-binding forkhead associated (FHA) protein